MGLRRRVASVVDFAHVIESRSALAPAASRIERSRCASAGPEPARRARTASMLMISSGPPSLSVTPVVRGEGSSLRALS
jgi:hypothetical protein